jgi:asparagine synthase (glutamine-hydrolysing)
MCGIAGIISPPRLDAGRLAAMGDALAHRGPDGEGFLVSDLREPLRMTRRPQAVDRDGGGPIVGLAHRRLSIIDLSEENDQPFVDPTGDYAIVHNGEIYNYLELRRELESHGHVFRTSGDTEVTLRAYIQWGSGCFERFMGMWAVAILDRSARTLVLSRDRFGIKPLYWTLASDCLLFASEIKGLLASGLVRAEPDEQTLARYLIGGRLDVDGSTFFSGVQQLPAASVAAIDLDAGILTPQPRPFWSLPSPERGTVPDEPATAVRAALEDSIRMHLRSDVAVGTCLSGGIDSSGIVALADTLRGDGVAQTLTHIAFGYVPPERELSERRFMEAVADRCDVELTGVEPTREEFLDALPSVIAAQDEPFGSASIAAQWFVFRAAHEAGVKVMLDGQGADEVFGGYHGYLTMMAEGLLLGGRPREFVRLMRNCDSTIGGHPYPLGFALAAMAPRGVRIGMADGLAALRRRRAATRVVGARHVSQRLHDLMPKRSFETRLDPDELLRADVQSMSLPGLLRYEDRNSMAHSIEARVPYLDHRLVELAFGIPALERMRGGMPKQVLRSALADVLPDAVMQRRDKIGFRASPSATWELARRERESLIEPGSDVERRWFQADEVARLIDSPNPTADVEFALWRVINTKLWARGVWGERGGLSS